MKAKVQILSIYTGDFTNSEGKKQEYHQVECLDLEAQKKEVLRLKLKAELLDTVAPAVGKQALVNVDFSGGKLSFIGFDKAA